MYNRFRKVGRHDVWDDVLAIFTKYDVNDIDRLNKACTSRQNIYYKNKRIRKFIAGNNFEFKEYCKAVQ